MMNQKYLVVGTPAELPDIVPFLVIVPQVLHFDFSMWSPTVPLVAA